MLDLLFLVNLLYVESYPNERPEIFNPKKLSMNNSLETNRIVTGSLFIIASIAVAFILNFAQPFLVPLVIALLIRILIDPIIRLSNRLSSCS